MSTDTPLVDQFSRPIRDLRISVTDRCNFRCVYCMPKEIFKGNYPFLGRRDLLSFEEITRLARLFAHRGVTKLRLTGGEPLVRRDLPKLIELLAGVEGIEDISLTTNGSLLNDERARTLTDAGLRRLTVSLDGITDDVFKRVNDVDFPVDRVLNAIDTAANAGLAPIKINMVVKRGMNEGEILPMAEYFRGSGHILRFIEFMDVGMTNGWEMDSVVSASEIAETIDARFPIDPIDPNYVGEVAKRWRYLDGAGEIGIISSVTQPFCGTCTRARLSAEGSIYTCLFATEGTDFRQPLRDGENDARLLARIDDLWREREDRYSQERSAGARSLRVAGPKIEMSYIGG
ncbi:MAG: GTP 3',8-cyclase MoaA [Pseudomonadota bacterium]